MPIKNRIDKQIVVYSHNGKLYKNGNKKCLTVCNYKNKSYKQCQAK